jgi:hypothetical protein
MTDAKAGVAAAGEELTTVRVDGTEMVMAAAVADTAPKSLDDWLTLPGFDEYMLGYKDRSMMLDEGHLDKIVPGGNGVFQATIVRAGRVVGTWKRTLGSKAVTVTATPLVPLKPAERRKVEDALEPYAKFVGLPLEVRWP